MLVIGANSGLLLRQSASKLHHEEFRRSVVSKLLRVAKARDVKGRENKRLSGTRTTVASFTIGRPFNPPLRGYVGTAGYCVHVSELHSLVQCDA